MLTTNYWNFTMPLCQIWFSLKKILISYLSFSRLDFKLFYILRRKKFCKNKYTLSKGYVASLVQYMRVIVVLHRYY